MEDAANQDRDDQLSQQPGPARSFRLCRFRGCRRRISRPRARRLPARGWSIRPKGQRCRRYQITAPDGATYEITAPDGTSEQDVLGHTRSSSIGAGGRRTATAAPTAPAAGQLVRHRPPARPDRRATALRASVIVVGIGLSRSGRCSVWAVCKRQRRGDVLRHC